MLRNFKRVLGELIVTKNHYLLRKKVETNFDVGFFYDDSKYKKYFDQKIGPHISQMHHNNYFTSCAFCTHLQKSSCHEFCFSCSKKTYTECSLLLPGTFSFTDHYFDSAGNDLTPWVFKTPCTNFECLNSKRYFKHFISSEQSITVANFEALEGIFLGISRGKRPCHICASVNIGIFNKCSESDKIETNKSCPRIIDEISKKYQAIQGMIKYVD